MPLCSLFLKRKASCFKAFDTCRKYTSGCLSWYFLFPLLHCRQPLVISPFFHILSVISLLQIHSNTMGKLLCPTLCIVTSSETPSLAGEKEPVPACLPASTKTSSSAAVHSCQSAAWCRDRLSRRKTGVVSGKVASRITPVSTKEPSSSVPDRGKSAS